MPRGQIVTRRLTCRTGRSDGVAMFDLINRLRTTRCDPARPRVSGRDWSLWQCLATALVHDDDPRGHHVLLEHRYARAILPAAERRLLRDEVAVLRAESERVWSARLGPGLRPILQAGLLRGIEVSCVARSPAQVAHAIGEVLDEPDTELLTHLAIRDHGHEVLHFLGVSDRLRRIHAVHVAECVSGNAAAVALATHAVDLRHVCLIRCELGDEGAMALASSPALAGVENLDLTGNFVSDRGVHALSTASWPRLTHLLLSDNDVGDSGALALAAAAGWPRLEELHLQRNFIEDHGVLALVESPHRGRMKILLLASNPMGPAGHLAHAQWRAT